MREIPFGRPIIHDEEKKEVLDALSGHILTHGPRVRKFEKSFTDFVGGGHSLAVASCTAALHLAYFYLGTGPGDEVIVPAQTHTATAHAVELWGGKPVFIDSEMETGNIDIDLIENSITVNTKAISVVHYLGMPVDMKKIRIIAKRHNLFVVEDCALAIGSYFNDIHAGLHGDVGCFSFYPVKHMTTGEGGMLVTKHKEIAEKINRQRAFGIDRQITERKVPGVYDIGMLGFNYRMSEIQAALGIEQLKRLNGFLRIRKENYIRLESGLMKIDRIRLFKTSYDNFQSSYYCLSIVLVDDLALKRFEIVKKLNENGVGTSIYYPQPVPLMTYYRRKYGYNENSFPNASLISNSSISLPVGPHLRSEDMDYIVNTFKKVISEV